jgi:hypothetical protein
VRSKYNKMSVQCDGGYNHLQEQGAPQQCAATAATQSRHARSSSAGPQDPQTCQQQQQDAEAAGDDQEARYLVRFRQYRMAAQHRATVNAALRSLNTANSSGPAPTHQAWRWIERNNKAAAYPTDFGLLGCGPAVAELLTVCCWLIRLCEATSSQHMHYCHCSFS